ncbi:MAG: hypothetical protein WAU84_02085 [Thermoguttaceae bacterium]
MICAVGDKPQGTTEGEGCSVGVEEEVVDLPCPGAKQLPASAQAAEVTVERRT